MHSPQVAVDLAKRDMTELDISHISLGADLPPITWRVAVF